MGRTVEMMYSKLGAVPLVLHFPVGEWSDFSGVWGVVRILASIGHVLKCSLYIVCPE